jgi:L-alanine-DL-glutamate epimerase-like enolase superfamily enzyme
VTGGITEGKKICDMAHAYGLSVQIHCCGSPVTIAAALQLEAVIPNFVIHEHIPQASDPKNLELCTPELKAVKGYYDVPDRPGLGIELNEKAVAGYPRIKVS